MNELALMDAWIYDRLVASAAIQAACQDRIYRDLAPDDADEPLIVYEATPSDDVSFVSTARVQINAEYTIRAVTRGWSFDEANAIADAIDAAMQNAQGEISGRQIVAVRARPVSYTTTEKDTRFNHAGGVYRLNLAGS